MKISSKIYTPKGQFRFIFTACVDSTDFDVAELSFRDIVSSLFGNVSYIIFQVDKL